MKKIVLIMLIFFIGCTILGGKSQQTDIIGTDGLVMKLGIVPKDVYIGQALQIPVTLENVGSSKIENAILTLDYNKNTINLDTGPIIRGINLEGKSLFVSVGEQTTKIFTAGSINLPGNKDTAEVLKLTACYQYKTEASPVVCINPKLVTKESMTPGGCDFTTAQLSPSQGAPIAVTKVETIFYREENKAAFDIYLKDVSGKGRVIAKDAYAKRCLGTETILPEETDIVDIEAFMGGRQLRCYSTYAPDTEVKSITIEDNGPSVICEADLEEDQQPFTTPLSIRLTYGYVIGQAFSINLKNPRSIK